MINIKKIKLVLFTGFIALITESLIESFEVTQNIFTPATSIIAL